MPTDIIKAQREIETERFILSTLPTLYLPLYKLDGSSFLSRDGFGHLCEVTGALWTLQGRSFDGTDDIVNCGDNTIFDIVGAITLEVWVKLNALGILQFLVGRDNGTLRNYWMLINTNNTVVFGFLTSDVSSGKTSTTTLSASVWYHLVGSYDKTNQRLFINGQEETPAVAQTGAIDNDDVSLTLGCRAVALDRDLNGVIGEVRIYSRALSPSEIQRNYLSTNWRYR